MTFIPEENEEVQTDVLDAAPPQTHPVENPVFLTRPKLSLLPRPLVKAHIEHSQRWREDVNFDWNQPVK